MALNDFPDLQVILREAPSPCFVVHEGLLRKNLAILDEVQRAADCKILLALKGFAMWSLFPLLRETLYGCCASGPIEAQLARQEFGREVHTFAAAFSEADIRELLPITDHLVFNSLSQWKRFAPLLRQAERPISVGLRINPEVSTAAVPLYDPCAPGSRLGILRQSLEGEDLKGVEGLHFHTLCEQNSDALEETLAGVEQRFGDILSRPQIRWLNMGGGHHITRADYDRERLVRLIREVRSRHPQLQEIYLEPGEAVVLGTGILTATILDIVKNGLEIAILDTSATCHMPDVLEMPYRPVVSLDGVNAGRPGEMSHQYRLGGLSCLAGDVIGDYSFPRQLQVGDRLVFHDMAHYSMVKTTTFNGVRLPSIASYTPEIGLHLHRRFGYVDYKTRLS